MSDTLGSRKALNSSIEPLPERNRTRPTIWSLSMQIAAHVIADRVTVTTASSSRLADRLLGLSLMAIVPALFWTALLAMVAPVFGFAPSGTGLATFGVTVAAFLGCVCCALTSQSA